MSKTNRNKRETENSLTNRNEARISGESITAAMEETLRLYHAWLGYLLTMQGADTLRVKAADIRRALDDLSCSVSREGDEYIIRLGGGGEAVHESDTKPDGGEACGG